MTQITARYRACSSQHYGRSRTHRTLSVHRSSQTTARRTFFEASASPDESPCPTRIHAAT